MIHILEMGKRGRGEEGLLFDTMVHIGYVYKVLVLLIDELL